MAKPTEINGDAFIRRFTALLVGIGAVVAVVVLGAALYVDSKLENVRDSLRYQASESAEAKESAPARDLTPVQGQTVYVPAYSHVYHQDGKSYLLTVTLSIRNTDIEGEVFVNSVRYFDTDGKLVKSYVEQPARLGPLATMEFLVERDDRTGGSGANFLVEWVAEKPVSEPIIEAVMIDTRGQQGISFARPGKVIRQHTESP